MSEIKLYKEGVLTTERRWGIRLSYFYCYCSKCTSKINIKACVTACLVKVPTAKPDDPSLMPKVYMMEGENKLPQIVL